MNRIKTLYFFVLISLIFLDIRKADANNSKKVKTTGFLASTIDFPTDLIKMVGGALDEINKESTEAKKMDQTNQNKQTINIVFSDVDGTLVHYPETVRQEDEPGNKTIYLPASSTGMRGVVSSKTLQLCQKLRREEKVQLVLVSGMRTSTLIKRLPYLPKCDAYASEAGGRIFYPVLDGVKNLITPVHFDGSTDECLSPFGLVEDQLWRTKMSEIDAAGMDGYVGDSMDIFLGKQKETLIIPISARKGALWDFARSLKEKGFIIDYKGYANCFRVNRKQQTNVSQEDFKNLQSIDVSAYGLATSVNLGCIDFYPIKSGKKNCCEYLADKFINNKDMAAFVSGQNENLLESCICLCDDDNDLEMAAACGKVFLPSVTSDSMKEAANQSPGKFIVTENEAEGIIEMQSTETSLNGAIAEFQRRRKMNELRP